jgi:hypothetical protein
LAGPVPRRPRLEREGPRGVTRKTPSRPQGQGDLSLRAVFDGRAGCV